MRKLEDCIATHNVVKTKNGKTLSIHANLYHIKNKYVVDYRCLLSDIVFSCQIVKDWTIEFNSMAEVDAYYSKGYFAPVISRLPTMPHD